MSGARHRKPYPSDLSANEWKKVYPLVQSTRTVGKRRMEDKQEIVNAILYVMRTGCTWRMLPHDLPPWRTVYYHYSRWQKDGTLEMIRIVLGQKSRSRQRSRAYPYDSQQISGRDEKLKQN